MANESLSSEQQEIVDLLIGELDELGNEDHSCFNSPEFGDQHGLLLQLSVHLEHIANALDIAGLGGLSFCTMRLRQVFKHLVDNQQPTPLKLEQPLSKWAIYFLAYLNSLSGSTQKEAKQDVLVSQLLGFLSQEALPGHLQAEDISHAKTLFQVSELTEGNEDSFPSEVTQAMCSLDTPTDVKQELLQGMLLELPDQTQQFEASINRFLTSTNFDELKQAQRIAHTIKGAANVVNIRGMANLTHLAEDLLETAAKSLTKPPQGFDDLLIQTSDCLATAAEFLNGQGPQPNDILQVMQDIVKWLATLKAHAKPDTNLTAETTVETPNAPPTLAIPQITPEASKAEEQNATENERHINLPERTGQELLRLSGEMQISGNQVFSQIANIETSLELTQRYHHQIRTMASELEALIQTQSALRSASTHYGDNEIDPLEMERFSELHTFSNRLQEITTDSVETISSIDQQVKELSGLTHLQKQLNRDNQNILLEMNLLPVGNLSSRLARCVRQTSRLTGKQANLNIIGEDQFIDSRVLNRIADPLMHLLRNAIDHGLEDAQLRVDSGKSEEGNLSLRFINRGDTLEIQCEDDGKGLDYKKIHKNAVDRGLLSKDSKLNTGLLSKFIFMPGFSTRGNATQTSGRGIGLDAVQSGIRALKGNISIHSKPGQGCNFKITVPTSILTSHALLVECRDRNVSRTYGIATRGIQQVLYISQDQFIQRDQQTYISHNNEEIPLQPLSELLDIYALENESITTVFITERRDGSAVAVGVEKVISSQDLVIKPLNNNAYQAPGVIGATILGDGNVSPVIDINDLPAMMLSESHRNMLQEKRARKILEERANFISPPAALVVDDSLSARRSLAQFVSDLGMEVYTAKDGFDAIQVMKEKKPSLMLVDLEMPRMNGLELTTHVRGRKEYQDIPVIMITSRSTQQHRAMAKNAGVTRYLTKPWSEDDLLNCIKKEIA